MSVVTDKMSVCRGALNVPVLLVFSNLEEGHIQCAPTVRNSSFVLTLTKIAHFGKRFVKGRYGKNNHQKEIGEAISA